MANGSLEEGRMRKRSHFDEFRGDGWPAPSKLERYFLAPPGELFRSWDGCWGLRAEGVDATEHLPEGKGRIDIGLTIVGNPARGVLLQYRKYGGGLRDDFYSKSDLSRLQEWLVTPDGDLMPIGLFIPFEVAWKAVKEFIERDGALPTSIAWVAGRDLPKDAFPDPALRFCAAG
jgi:Immunity protein Imm1